MYYDAHTHLNDEKLYPERKNHLQKFIDTGGKGLINVGVDIERSQKAISIAREAEIMGISCRVKATVGYHPSEVCFGKITRENIDKKMEELEKIYEDNKKYIIAIGECGIDTHYPDGSSNIALQKEVFRRQCAFAQKVGLPVVIHSRDDFASTFEVVKEFKNEKIYFHCYGYGADEARRLHEYFPNLRIGFCGNITYPKAQQLRDALLACHISSIVFETDAPYLSPQAVRGEVNEPMNVQLIYQYAAPLLGKSEKEVQYVIEENIKKLYSL